MTGPFARALRDAGRTQRRVLVRACLCAALVGSASVLLLGLSGWFLTAAAAAGAAGPIVVQGFNYMLPAAGIRLLAIARTGARYGERLTSHAAALRTTATLRERLFRAIAAMPVARALSVSAGEASSHLVQHVAAIEGALVRRTAPWALFSSLGAAVALLLFAGWPPAAALAGCTAATFGVVELASRRLARLERATQRSVADLKTELAMLLQAAAELRCYGLDGWAAERIRLRERALGDAQRATTAALGMFDAIIAGGGAVAGASCFVLASHAGAPVAALAALAAIMAVDGAGALARDRAASGGVAAAAARLDAIFGAPDAPVAEATAALSTVVVATPIEITLRGRLALTGPSGCGKTSLVEALIGLRAFPAAGVTIDRRDIEACDGAWLRAQFAWCPQDAMLLAGSVRANLSVAAGDGDEAMLWEALEDAMLADRVRALGGLDVWIGENGERLSGGERRRLALARAYLRPSPCLLLDEPTEGLDRATENKIVAALARRLERTGQGLILVSHRSAPLQLCERRIAIDIAPSRHTALAA